MEAYADGVPIQDGAFFDEPFELTVDVTVTGAPASDVQLLLDSHRVDLSSGRVIGPGEYTLAVVSAASADVSFTPQTLRFEVKDPKAPFECVARASVNSDDELHVVTVLVEGCADAMPTQWTIDIMTGGRPRGSYTLASYRLEDCRPRLDDPTDAVFENGQWRLRFVIPRSEVPDPIEDISLTGFIANSQGRVLRPISCRVSF